MLAPLAPETRVLVGDCRDWLKKINDNSIHCVVTSPPYWGLRDYGVANQIGLEQSPLRFVEEMVGVFREVRRVLRDDGTLWLNLGDSYAGSGRGGNPDAGTKQGTNKGSQSVGVLYGREHASAESERQRIQAQQNELKIIGVKPKDLIGIPWRVAFALQADGWYLRQDIIWAKPNPMPESMRDRCTRSHEYIFMFSKSTRYFYDIDAIREPFITAERKGERRSYKPGSASSHRLESGHEKMSGSFAGLPLNPKGKNRRSVWNITPAPFKEAHFATFPPDLVEPCILAGSPVGGIVLDPFGGAGTTGLVAKRNNRHAVMIELNAEYAAMAEKRIAAG